jgi:hypothetical protein
MFAGTIPAYVNQKHLVFNYRKIGVEAGKTRANHCLDFQRRSRRRHPTNCW